jgi:phosphoserine aminotransferase
MISFYPGPSRVYDEIPKYVADAHKAGVLSMNHRSDEFMKISENVISLLKAKLKIPKDYTIFYTTSATECWEIIAQSIVSEKSIHVYNGAFGEKWFEYTKRLRPKAEGVSFGIEETLKPKNLRWSDGEVICLTQNETSNGTQVSNTVIQAIRKNNPNHLVAVDATSSMGGMALNFRAADIWLASVQKCFGLPAGLGLMACSPRAMERAMGLGEKDHYNSLTFMARMMEKWQTPFTPNVLNIYLLMRVMEKAPDISITQQRLEKRYAAWMKFLNGRKDLHHLVENPAAHSTTVIPIKGTPEAIQEIKTKAKKKGLLLGEGYGDWKSSTFRIANFPALKQTEIDLLKRFLTSF